jgi:hypothetical protein
VSRNIANLMFAGRDASCTHAAMSATRVMATGCSMGQAAGTAAALSVHDGTDPCGVDVADLQQALLSDDAYLPWTPQRFGPLTTGARLSASQGDPEPLRDGINRPVGDHPHRWACRQGDWVALEFDGPQRVDTVTAIVDSALHRNVQMSYHQRDDQLTRLPDELPHTLRFEGLSEGAWSPIADVADNHQRLVRVPIGRAVEAVRCTVVSTWGADETGLHALYVD